MNIARNAMTALAAVSILAALPASASTTEVAAANSAARLMLSAQGATAVPQYGGHDCALAGDNKWYWHNPANDRWFECKGHIVGEHPTNWGLIIAGIAIAGGLGLGLGLGGGNGGPASP